jgi:hypothetical protein
MDRPVVLLNPKMEDIAIIGIGYAGRMLRERFLNTFESCYYLRYLEGAAIFRAYPQPWQVWLETEAGYELVAEEPQKPVGDVLDRILAAAAGDSRLHAAVPPRLEPVALQKAISGKSTSGKSISGKSTSGKAISGKSTSNV